MKKLIAALMSLCLILTAAAALGETAEEAVETEPIVVNWSDYEAAVEDVDGQFAQVSDTGLVMFIPAMFKDTELSDETLEGGTFLVLKSETEENVVVSAQYAAVDIALFKAGLASQGVTLYDVTLNGLPCCMFNVEGEGIVTSCVAFGTEQGGTLVFGFAPSDQEPWASLFRVMAASIQPAE